MPEIIEQYYVPLLKGHGFIPDPDDHQYGFFRHLVELSPRKSERGPTGPMARRISYDIKIHNFSFHEDSLLEFSLPECLSITRYDSISGEELAPVPPAVRRVHQNLYRRVCAIPGADPQEYPHPLHRH